MKRWLHTATDLLIIIIGAQLTALSMNWFLVPNRIAAGGVSGLATIIHHWLGWPVGATTIVLNLPLLIGALFVLGWSRTAKTLLGAALYSLFIDLLAPFVHPLTYDPLLAAMCGGLLGGVGMGLCFRGGGSTGGTDVAALLLERYSRRHSVANLVLLSDGVILLLAAFAFTPELALYALMSLIVGTMVINSVLEGLPYARQVLIVTKPGNASLISDAIMQELGRGVTALTGKGMYTDSERCVLLVAVVRGELHSLISLVAASDPEAFVMISDVRRVLGEGFDQVRISRTQRYIAKTSVTKGAPR